MNYYWKRLQFVKNVWLQNLLEPIIAQFVINVFWVWIIIVVSTLNIFIHKAINFIEVQLRLTKLKLIQMHLLKSSVIRCIWIWQWISQRSKLVCIVGDCYWFENIRYDWCYCFISMTFYCAVRECSANSIALNDCRIMFWTPN